MYDLGGRCEHMAVYFFSLAAACDIMFPFAGLCRQPLLQPLPEGLLQPLPSPFAGLGVYIPVPD